MIFERSTESCAPFFSAPPKKSAQISTTLKVSVKPFSKACGVEGQRPRRPSAMVNKVYRRNPLYFKKTEQGVRNAKAFRGEAYKTASPFYRPEQINPPKRSGGTFGTKQLLRAFAQSQYFFDRLSRTHPCGFFGSIKSVKPT